MPATDARPVPRKNTAFRFYFSIRSLATGGLITSWTGADSEVSLDGAAFADCTNEATEIGTSGCGFIDLEASEMNADAVLLKITLTNANAETLVVTLFPEELGDYRVNGLDAAGIRAAIGLSAANLDTQLNTGFAFAEEVHTVLTAGAGGWADVSGWVENTNTQIVNVDNTLNEMFTKVDAAFDATGKLVSLANNAITAASIATDSITAAKLATDAGDEIATRVRANLATELGRIDAAITSRLAAASYVAPDNASIAAIGTIVALVDARLPSDPADQSQVQAAITAAQSAILTVGGTGPWTTGSGGGGGDPWATALPGSYSSGTAGYIVGNLTSGSGAGARTVTITVTLSASPLQGAIVRLTKGGETYVVETNVSGQAVFNIDDGTWTVAITASGASFAGASLVVDGTESQTYAMTATSIAPSDPGKRTGYLVCYDENGEVEAGVSVTMVCYYAPSSGLALDSEPRVQTSDINGLVNFTNLIVGAKYRYFRSTGEYRLTVPSGSGSFELDSIVGEE